MSMEFCSQQAKMSGAPLAGTATEATVWLLLEVPAPWGRKALAESRLPDDIKSFLLEWESVEGRRVQLIRREINVFDTPGSVTAFLALVRPAHDERQAPKLYRFRSSGYSDLLPLLECKFPAKADALITQSESDERSVYEDLVFLTCTNSRRDACCAKWGRPMAEATAKAAGKAAWHTSHLGGHRFAPTQLVLPHGSQYGRLEPGEAVSLVEAHLAGDLYRLDRYRGHVRLPRPVQAAEVFLREKLDLRELDALALVEASRDGEGPWRVRFQENDVEHELTIKEETGSPTPTSCGRAPKPNTYFVLNNYNRFS